MTAFVILLFLTCVCNTLLVAVTIFGMDLSFSPMKLPYKAPSYGYGHAKHAWELLGAIKVPYAAEMQYALRKEDNKELLRMEQWSVNVNDKSKKATHQAK